MKFKIQFTLHHIRHTGITSDYRPNWISDSKPHLNGARFTFSDKPKLELGETGIGLLEPLCPELWNNVSLNDTLSCMEGNNVVGTAKILEIL